MDELQKSKPRLVEVGLSVCSRYTGQVREAYVQILVPAALVEYSFNKASVLNTLDESLSVSLKKFIPSDSIKFLEVRLLPVNSFPSSPLNYKGRDTFHIASRLSSLILAQFV